MPLKFFIDESYTPGGIFIMGGQILDSGAVGEFSSEWQKILPSHGCDRRKDGVRHFKMAQMAMEGRMNNVPAFAKIVEQYATALISLKFNIDELESARARICIPGNTRGIDWGVLATPYRIAFMCLMDMFNAREKWQVKELPSDSVVIPFFDETTEKSVILRAWSDLVESKPEHRRQFYVEPQFKDDTEMLPLQGADLWAWWVRRWYEDGTPEKVGGFDIGLWRGTRSDLPKLNFTFDEDQLFYHLARSVRRTLTIQLGSIGSLWPIFDRASWKPVC
ncbi:MAG: DUF3800 domain-containing protein [Alphaproteobacteria bacterium]